MGKGEGTGWGNGEGQGQGSGSGVGHGYGEGSGSAAGYGQGEGGWQHEWYDICHDTKTCLCVTFCTYCSIYSTAEKVNENGLLCCLLSCFLPCVATTLIRSAARHEKGIDGSIVEDALCSCCCLGCVLCQVNNEMDS